MKTFIYSAWERLRLLFAVILTAAASQSYITRSYVILYSVKNNSGTCNVYKHAWHIQFIFLVYLVDSDRYGG